MIDTVRIVHKYKNRIWIEDDLRGDRHVMIQGEWPQAPCCCYATFHSAYPYTTNSGTLDVAEACARSLGATDPIERRVRDLLEPPK